MLRTLIRRLRVQPEIVVNVGLPIDQAAEQMRAFDPHVIDGYPGYLEGLATHLGDRPREYARPRFIPDQILLVIEPRNDADPSELERLRRVAERELASAATVEIRFVDAIEPTPSGKYKYAFPYPTPERPPGGRTVA